MTNDDTNQLDDELDSALEGNLPALLMQQPNESALQFAAFLAYLRLGVHRSIRQVAAEGGHDERHTQRWSSRFEWGRRAAYFDALKARAQLRDMLQEVAA